MQYTTAEKCRTATEQTEKALEALRWCWKRTQSATVRRQLEGAAECLLENLAEFDAQPDEADEAEAYRAMILAY